ncbi:hypothetical protein [Microbacterium luticocti]|uniref:hypothetical protein n=1 Tax=Microbacterium luticocti TaxID=451764 RepID=UPI00040819CB|nr:hypothetical protein [Microbacterium luticocti]
MTPHDAPGEGRGIPLPLLRGAAVLVSCAAFAAVPAPYAIAVVALTALGALLPTTLATWGAVLVVGLGQLLHPGWLATPAPFVALALAHALHVLGGFGLALPGRGRLQLRALIAPARRWLVVQLVAQPVLAAALLVQHAPVRALLPAWAVVIVTALCAVVIVVLLRLLAARR